MAWTKDSVRQVVERVTGPGGLRPGVEWVSVCEGFVGLRLRAEGEPADRGVLAAACRGAIERAGEGSRLESLVVEFVDGQGKVVQTVKFGSGERPAEAPQPEGRSAGAEAGHRPIGGLAPAEQGGPPARRIIAVGAGKGGVGKSTIAVNLAVGLALRGRAVGLLDGDIYGPSLPTMLGLDALEQVVHAGRLQPFLVSGVKAITIGKLVDPERPLIWRGPMAHGAFKQLVEQTDWGDLDDLVIDLPPGTGDVALTMAQSLTLTGAVVVCTPQKVAQDDAARATRMFQQLGIDVLGIVENMSYFVGDDGKVYDLFGRGGAEVMAQRLGVPFLGAVPITTALRKHSDEGTPRDNFEHGTDLARALEGVVTAVEQQAALAEMRGGKARPVLKVT